MKPDFTPEEEFVLAYYRDEKMSSAKRSNCFDGARVFVACGMFAYGICGGDSAWMVIGFLAVLYGAIRGMFENGKYVRIFRSIFKKYEDALDQSVPK